VKDKRKLHQKKRTDLLSLCARLPKDVIRLNHPVCEIERLDDGVLVTVGRLDEEPEFLPPSGKTSFWDGSVHFAGTETADQLGGYLEGALSSAERAVATACSSSRIGTFR
jgi:monoamine oxidase